MVLIDQQPKPFTATSTFSRIDQQQFQSNLSNIEITKNVSQTDSDEKLRTSPTKKMTHKVMQKEQIDVSILDEFDQTKLDQQQIVKQQQPNNNDI